MADLDAGVGMLREAERETGQARRELATLVRSYEAAESREIRAVRMPCARGWKTLRDGYSGRRRRARAPNGS